MKTAGILTILLLALGLMLCWPKTTRAAEPMSSAFTYQGHLYDNNDVANGLYDFQFKLYKYIAAPANDYIQVGNDVNRPDVDVIDSYFTVELDFGSSVFNGNARWLEIGVRPGVESDPNDYTALSPRQEVTAVPYALQTRGIFVDDALNVGIGTNIPSTKLDVVGTVTATAFVGDRSSLTGIAADSDWTVDGNDMYSIPSGNVGIGTTSPDAKLDIVGDVNVTGSVATSGAVIMATNTGSGDGVEGKSWGSSGCGVEGWALWSGPGANYGGYFRAEGNSGYGVYGYASNNGNYENYGGYFMAQGQSGIGAYGFVMGDNGQAIKGMAFDSGVVTNYGGHFTANGASGRGVYGEATKTGAVENYGGYFTAAGNQGRAVYGEAAGSNGVGVYGEATGGGKAGHFEGDVHVNGNVDIVTSSSTTSLEVTNSSSGYGIYGSSNSYGVYGEHSNSGNYGDLGSSFCGVRGVNNSSGNFGYLGTELDGAHASSYSGNGVYGYSHTGHGVHGSSSTGYAGYFVGNVFVEDNCSAQSFTDRTPYPKDLATAYQAVMSMERLPEGQYDENNREVQLDHSKLSDFIRSKDGNRNLSATVSCLNEVVKDLVRKVEDQHRLIKIQNTQIQQMAKQLKINKQPQAVIMKGAVQ